MARPRNNFISMVNDDGEVSLEELLTQIEQLQPVNQQAETTYQAEPVFVPSQESVYQPVIQQPEVQQPYVEPQTVQEVINQIATQLPPSVVNEIIARQPIEQPIQQDADAPVEQMVAPQTLLQTTEPTQKTEETKSTKPSDSVIESLTQQILGQGTSENWQGGVDAKTAAKDMAKIMAGIGITDIRQFGKIPDLVTAEVQYGVNGQVARQDEDGNYYIMAQGGTDSEGNQINYRQNVSEADLSPIYGYRKTIDGEGNTAFEAVDPSKVVTRNGQTLVQVGETYGNKETGQVVPNTYSERQTGNAFGGTFEGSGNTGYRVDFAPDGTPVFYTTKSSSNDLLNIMASNPVVNAVATYFAYQAGGPAGVAALNAAQGKDIKDVAKATLLTYLGNEVIAPYISKTLPTPDVPIDFVEGTTEQINDALQSQFVNDLKAAGVTNVSEFITNTGGNASSFVPSEVTPVIEPTVAPIENVQVSAPVTSSPTINEVVNAIVNQQTLPEVQVTSPIQTTTPTINEVINAITQTAVTEPTVVQQTAQTVSPIETVKVTEPTQTVAPTTSQIVNAITQSGITEPSVIEKIINAVTTPEVQITESTQPVTPTINSLINAIVQPTITASTTNQPTGTVVVPQTPTLEVTTPRVETPTTVDQVIASIIPELIVSTQAAENSQQTIPTIIASTIQPTLPEVTTIAQKPSTITNETEPAPVIVAPPITGTVPPKTYTASEIIDMIRLGVFGSSVLSAATQDTGPTGFPIVPVPEDWKSPTYTKDLPTTAPTQLPPIDFGNRNLLIGTQWEKFLDPNYGKVPAPVQFNQPSDMSYDRLMSILGTSRDVLPSQAISINDVISGIQNQYGQTPTGSMG
jgi:hypothetical protein